MSIPYRCRILTDPCDGGLNLHKNANIIFYSELESVLVGRNVHLANVPIV